MRPYVICHMMCSVDGRTLSKNWGTLKGTQAYEQVHRSFSSQAWMCGRVTMEKDFAGHEPLNLEPVAEEVPEGDFVADHGAKSFAIAVDQSGRLRWTKAEIDGDHIIEVLSEQVSPAYLAHLRRLGISYIFAGSHEIDFSRALNKLAELFPIKTIMLEGGGHLNGSLLDAGLIDEISVLHVPVADGSPGAATVFDKAGQPLTEARHLKLIEVKQLENDVIWTHYRVV